jgi:hypothetical protein
MLVLESILEIAYQRMIQLLQKHAFTDHMSGLVCFDTMGFGDGLQSIPFLPPYVLDLVNLSNKE